VIPTKKAIPMQLVRAIRATARIRHLDNVPSQLSTVDDFLCRSNLQRTTRSNSFEQSACKSFNINHLKTTDFVKVQQGLESGSGPGALPGAPRGTLLYLTAENLRAL
jgi:hypothetical protein